MALVVPNGQEEKLLDLILNQSISLRLYSNNKTPANTDVVGDYTEVSGGGYAAVALTFANWVSTAGSPTEATYATHQSFTFTGASASPTTVYGYYMTDAAGVLLLAERFPAANVPFIPRTGALVRIRPTITLASVSGD